MTDEEAAGQVEAAADAIRAALLGLLRAGEVHPRLVVMAAAQVAGELAAGAALAGGEDVGAVVDEVAEVVREAGRGHGEALRAVTMPIAGSA